MQQATIGEVTTLWLDEPAAGVPRATLDFRVGAADEPLPSRGITLLALRLCFAAADEAGFELDGSVDDVRLHLHFQAEPEELAVQIGVVARALHGTPAATIDRERRSLRADMERRDEPPGQYSWALARLCGPNGAGRLGYKLLGLRRVSADEVVAWTARHCTRGNAVVTLECPPTDELAHAFAALPPGPRIGAPETRPVPGLALPAQTSAATDEVFIAALLESGEAAEALPSVIEDRAGRGLREVEAEAWLTPIDGRSSLLRVTAPAEPDTAGRVRDALLGVLDEVATDGALEPELAAWRSRREDDLGPLDAEDLRQMAFAALHGLDVATPEDRAAAARALRPDEVAVAARRALDGALVVLPEGAAEPPAPGHSDVDDRPDPEVGGREWRRSKGPRHELVCRDEGIVLSRSGEIVAIRFDDLAVAVREDDGALHLVATTGSWIEVDPGEDGDDLVEELAARVPDGLLVRSSVEVQRARVREAAATLRSRALLGEVLRALPQVLRADEEIQAMVRARVDWALGLLVVTPRRVLFAPAGEDPRLDVEELLRADVVSATADRRLTGTELVIRSRRGRELKLRAGRAKELARLIGGG